VTSKEATLGKINILLLGRNGCPLVSATVYLRGSEVSGNVEETWHGTLEAATAKLAPSQSPHFRKLLHRASRSPSPSLWHGRWQTQVCCHILAKSIKFTYDTLRWFAMRYRYHEVESSRPPLPESPLAAHPTNGAFHKTPDVFLSLHIPSTSTPPSLPSPYRQQESDLWATNTKQS